MNAQAKKKSAKAKVLKAKWKDIDLIIDHRKEGLKELYARTLNAEAIEALVAATTHNKTLEHTIEKGTLYMFYNVADEFMGHMQFKYAVISGENGICELLSFFIDPDYLAEDDFAYGLTDIEQKVVQAGCYKVKGSASHKEFQLLKPYGYDIAAPKYRHSFQNISINFVPFTKTLYHPKF